MRSRSIQMRRQIGLMSKSRNRPGVSSEKLFEQGHLHEAIVAAISTRYLRRDRPVKKSMFSQTGADRMVENSSMVTTCMFYESECRNRQKLDDGCRETVVFERLAT